MGNGMTDRNDEMAGKQVAQRISNVLHQPSAREKLDMQKAALLEHLTNIDAAIKALDENPGAEQVMDALRKVNI